MSRTILETSLSGKWRISAQVSRFMQPFLPLVLTCFPLSAKEKHFHSKVLLLPCCMVGNCVFRLGRSASSLTCVKNLACKSSWLSFGYTLFPQFSNKAKFPKHMTSSSSVSRCSKLRGLFLHSHRLQKSFKTQLYTGVLGGY